MNKRLYVPLSLLISCALLFIFSCKKENTEPVNPFIGKYKGTLNDTLYIDGVFYNVTQKHINGNITFDSIASKLYEQSLFFGGEKDAEIIYLEESNGYLQMNDSFSISGFVYKGNNATATGKLKGSRLIIKSVQQSPEGTSPAIKRIGYAEYVKIP